VFEISAFGSNRLYRIIYANILYFVVIHGGPLLLIAFFNVKLIHALKRRQRRWAEMGKNWYQQDISVVLVVVMCVFIVCQTPTFVDHILSISVTEYFPVLLDLCLFCVLCFLFTVTSEHFERLRRTSVKFLDHILWTFVDEKARTCGHWHYYYTAIGDFLVIFNSSVNFVIYIVTNRNFRQGLMLMQKPASLSGRNGERPALAAARGRRGGTVLSSTSPARTEYIGLERPMAGTGSTAAAASAEVTAETAVSRRAPALTPIAERSPALVRHTATTATRYFEPIILLH